MVISIKISTSFGEMVLEKKLIEIYDLIDKIQIELNEFIKFYGKKPEFIVLNETDLLFIDKWLYRENKIEKDKTLFGLKTRKMKLKGFIFAYE